MDNPLSLVPSEGNANEFPVLKAFQEYIDAEQAKARKRMLGLSVFFIVLLSVVVVTFVLILTTVLNRNQSLSDRLLDYALREREKISVVQAPAPAAAPQSQPSADIVKTLIERMEKEQAEMKAAFEKQRKDAERNAAEQERARNEEMTRIRAELAKERENAKREAKRKSEIERHRRRLYPDYYRMEEASDDLPIPPPASAYKRRIQPVETPSSSHATVEGQLPHAQKRKPASPLSDIKPVTYFNVDDDDSVPFLIETPKQNK